MEIILLSLLLSLPYLLSFGLSFTVGVKIYQLTYQKFTSSTVLYSIVLFLGFDLLIRKFLLMLMGAVVSQSSFAQTLSILNFIIGAKISPLLNILLFAVLIFFVYTCKKNTPATSPSSGMQWKGLLLSILLVIILLVSYGRNLLLLPYVLESKTAINQIEDIVESANRSGNPLDCIALSNKDFKYVSLGDKTLYEVKTDCVLGLIEPEVLSVYQNKCIDANSQKHIVDNVKEVMVVDFEKRNSCTLELAEEFQEPSLCVLLEGSTECKQLFPEVYNQ